MEPIRAPFQGILNIIRFNWHFYVLAIMFLTLILVTSHYINPVYSGYVAVVFVATITTICISFLVSYYVYDLSGLYKLNWLNVLIKNPGENIININAGFDETSVLLQHKYKASQLAVFDFYDPAKHTEVSIKRARKAYPPFPETISVTTKALPLSDKSINTVFLILAAHEIRNEEERIFFFKELKRILSDDGQIVVTEHLRDISNFIAYNIGFFHFMSKPSWLHTFKQSGFIVEKEIKVTPFISTFILKKHGA